MADPLPPPGPDHYAARRAQWLTSSRSPAPQQIPLSIARLNQLLDHPDPHADPVWSRGIDQVWNGLIDGKRLKYRLPMSLLIKVLHAAWRRDPETWPEGAVVPDSDSSRTVFTSSSLPGGGTSAKSP